MRNQMHRSLGQMLNLIDELDKTYPVEFIGDREEILRTLKTYLKMMSKTRDGMYIARSLKNLETKNELEIGQSEKLNEGLKRLGTSYKIIEA